jgi:hypothetical protein
MDFKKNPSEGFSERLRSGDRCAAKSRRERPRCACPYVIQGDGLLLSYELVQARF